MIEFSTVECPKRFYPVDNSLVDGVKMSIIISLFNNVSNQIASEIDLEDEEISDLTIIEMNSGVYNAFLNDFMKIDRQLRIFEYPSSYPQIDIDIV